MKILFGGNKERGALCLKALHAKGHQIVGVLAHPSNGKLPPKGGLIELARQLNLPVYQPSDVNDPEVVESFRKLRPDLIVLAGYGPIINENVIAVAPKGSINLHGGKLPQIRGSSPMNWAMINNRKEFTLSIIQVDKGVDSGEVLLDKTFKIRPGDTIADLDRTASEAFPKMLIEVVGRLEKGRVRGRKQNPKLSAYYPLRFPDDGFIVWDMFTAEQIHNRIRALTDPYPCAFTYFQRRKIGLPASRLTSRPFYGEPGRIYRTSDSSLLVAASDRCLWIDRPIFEDTRESAILAVKRYDKFPTMRDAVAILYGLGDR